MSKMDETQFYKAVLENDGKFTSVLVNQSIHSVVYKAGEVCHAQYGKVFVFAGLHGTLTHFANFYSRLFSKPVWAFKVEVDRPSLKHSIRVPVIWEDAPVEDMDYYIQLYWEMLEQDPSDLFGLGYPVDSVNGGTWITNWVVLTRAMSIHDVLDDKGTGRAINYHDRQRVNIDKKWTKQYV